MGVLCQPDYLPSGKAVCFSTSSCLKVTPFTKEHVKNSTVLTLQKKKTTPRSFPPQLPKAHIKQNTAYVTEIVNKYEVTVHSIPFLDLCLHNYEP